MQTRKIKDKNGNIYIIEVDENTFKKDTQNGHLCWLTEFTVKDRNGGEVGFGSFRGTCLSRHRHLSDKKFFKRLITIGALKIKKSIDKGESIESVGYNMRVENCRK